MGGLGLGRTREQQQGSVPPATVNAKLSSQASLKMKAPTLEVITLVALASSVSGNFHVGRSVYGTGPIVYRACSSGNYKCNRFAGAGGTSGRDAQLPSGQNQLQTYFQVKSGLCGAPLLDFYKKADGSWDFYHNNGDGQVKGTCYTNDAGTQTCYAAGVPFLTYTDKLVCYSSICG